MYTPTSFNSTAIFSDNTKIVGRLLGPLPIKEIVLSSLLFIQLNALLD